MNHILVEGEAGQLAGFVKMLSHNIPVRYVRLETQLATLTFGDSFLRYVFRENANNASTALSLLLMEGFTTAIISSGTSSGNFYYLFDSYSRDERGMSVINGTSVFMKFNDLFEIEKYIQEAYLEQIDRQEAYVQI